MFVFIFFDLYMEGAVFHTPITNWWKVERGKKNLFCYYVICSELLSTPKCQSLVKKHFATTKI